MKYLEDRIDLFGMPCRKGASTAAHIIGDGDHLCLHPTDKVRLWSIPLTETIGIREAGGFHR